MIQCGMADDALLRRENLLRFMKLHGITSGQLAIDLGNSKGYVSDLLSGNKSFGEKIARRIEAQYHMTRGALDEADGPMDTVPAVDWPFERITPQLWAGLTERQRGAIEAAAVAAMRELQSGAALPESPSRKQPARGA